MRKTPLFVVLLLSMFLASCITSGMYGKTERGPMGFCHVAMPADIRENVGEKSEPPPETSLYILCTNGQHFRIHKGAVELLPPVGGKAKKNP